MQDTVLGTSHTFSHLISTKTWKVKEFAVLYMTKEPTEITNTGSSEKRFSTINRVV